MSWAIIAHGGAGSWEGREAALAHQGLVQALEAGVPLLRAGASALDACEAALQVLEDLPLFNAGLGSVLNQEGDCEMDACIMHGPTLQAGACAGVRRVRHPIALARRVMERTSHVLLAGEGAERLARQWGLEERDPRTHERIAQWRRLTQQAGAVSPAAERGNTVGCIVLDGRGAIAAGTSTGGMALKLPGRIGDTPIPGAGTYATPLAGVSCTGHGEVIMRVLLAKEVCRDAATGNVQSACEAGLRLLEEQTGSRDAGLIALSASGDFGMARSTRAMPVAYWREGMEDPGLWV